MGALIFLVCCVGVGYFAQQRGRSAIGWGLGSLVISPLLAGIILLFLKDLSKTATPAAAPMPQRPVQQPAPRTVEKPAPQGQRPAAQMAAPAAATAVSQTEPQNGPVPPTPAAVNAFCTACGSKLEAGAKFCTNCGQPVGQ